jgi:isopentenyl-diphosphate Delta-isomerase
LPAPTADTLIDRVDDLDRPIGTILRGEALQPGVGFRVAHVLVKNNQGQMLLQQVGAHRRRSALRWGSSVAAYLFAGESYSDAASRRLREEIGLTTPLRYLGKVRMVDEGAIKFIGVFDTMAQQASVMEPDHIETLSFWNLKTIGQALRKDPSAFTETFPFVFKLYLSRQNQVTDG